MEYFKTINMWFLVTIAYMFLIAGIHSQEVSFVTIGSGSGSDSTTVIVGQPVEFLCSYNGFNPSTDRMEIIFQGMVALVLDNGMFTQHSVPSGSEYSTEIINQVVGVASGILLRINAINVTDAGQYQCSITDSTQTYQSQIISITTDPSFPTPVCFAQSADAFLDPVTGNINAQVGVMVTVPCIVSTGMAFVPVTLAWSRSDEKPVEQSGNFSPSYLSFVPSLGDNFVDFTCTATSSQYQEISQSCSFQLTVSEPFGAISTTARATALISATTDHADQNKAKASSGTMIISTQTYVGLIVGNCMMGGLLAILITIIAIYCIIRHVKRKKESSVAMSGNSPYYSTSIPAISLQEPPSAKTSIPVLCHQESSSVNTLYCEIQGDAPNSNLRSSNIPPKAVNRDQHPNSPNIPDTYLEPISVAISNDTSYIGLELSDVHQPSYSSLKK